MKKAPSVSPEAMTIFLKQAALEEHWTTAYLAKALGLDPPTSKQFAQDLSLAGYIEQVPRKRDTWRNADAGNKLAGVRAARLTRAKAQDLLGDLADRAGQFNLEHHNGLRIQRVVALGSILTEHDRIQDIDVAVQLRHAESGHPQHARELDALKFLKRGSPFLRMHRWDDTLARMPARTVWTPAFPAKS
jgi:hypothetical protein